MNSSNLQEHGRGSKASCWTRCALLALCGLVLFGCRTTDGSGTGSMASVVIRDASLGTVRGATIDVFEGHMYKIGRMDKECLVFERAGSRWDNVAYGNWTEARVWDRVKVVVESLSESTVRVRCTGYLVRDKGGATEEEIKAHQRGPYQKLMDEISGRLNPTPAK